jgi:hypothetical protein
MKVSKSFFFLVSLMLIVAFAIILWNRLGSATNGRLETSMDGKRETALSHSQIASSAGDIADSKRPALQQTSLANRLASAKNIRSFVSYALTVPEEGGYFYAVFAIQHCAALKQELSDLPQALPYNPNEPHEAAVRRDNALERLRSRCSGFTDEDLSGAMQLDILRRPDKERDPFLELSRKLDQSRSKSQEQYKSSLAAILATGDPLLLRIKVLTEISTADSTYVGESRYQGARDVLLISWALDVVPCSLGTLSCDNADFEVIKYCALMSACYDDRRQLVFSLARQEFGDEGQAQLAKIERDFLSIIQQRDVSLLVDSAQRSRAAN